jgi:hypothetical protein
MTCEICYTWLHYEFDNLGHSFDDFEPRYFDSIKKTSCIISKFNYFMLLFLLRNQRLGIHPFSAIKSKSVQHGKIITPVEIDCAIFRCEMLVSVPTRNGKRIALLPTIRCISNNRVTLPFNYVVDRGTCIPDGRRRCASVQALRSSSEGFAHYL